jgi:hypothetical protein
VRCRLFAAALASGAVASGGLATSGTASADSAASRVAVAAKRAELAHRWGDLWRLLHPAQRHFIPRATFVACYRNLHRVDAAPRSIAVVTASPTRLRLPGALLPVRSARITLKVMYTRAPSQRAEMVLAESGGRWYWTTSARSLVAFEKLTFCA